MGVFKDLLGTMLSTFKIGKANFSTSGLSAARTITVPDASFMLVGTDTTDTLSNKRINPRVNSVVSSSTPTPNADSDDWFVLTALAVNATFGAPTGTPVNGQSLIIRIKDDGVARTLAFNAIYRGIGVTLPTTTAVGKTIYLGFKFNSADTKWDLLALGTG